MVLDCCRPCLNDPAVRSTHLYKSIGACFHTSQHWSPQQRVSPQAKAATRDRAAGTIATAPAAAAAAKAAPARPASPEKGVGKVLQALVASSGLFEEGVTAPHPVRPYVGTVCEGGRCFVCYREVVFFGPWRDVLEWRVVSTLNPAAPCFVPASRAHLPCSSNCRA